MDTVNERAVRARALARRVDPDYMAELEARARSFTGPSAPAPVEDPAEA